VVLRANQHAFVNVNQKIVNVNNVNVVAKNHVSNVKHVNANVKKIVKLVIVDLNNFLKYKQYNLL
jgi:hypothetical protein